MDMLRTTRRWRVGAVVAIASLAVAGCGQSEPAPADSAGSSEAGASDEPVELRMTWWGSEERHAATQAALDLFEQKHPNITVEGEGLPFDGYADRIATELAAGSAPDVMQLAVEVVPEYADKGALLDLDAVDLADVDVPTSEAANLDGEQLAVATGLATSLVVVNADLLAEYGLEVPDDETWTWDDYLELAAEVSQAGGDGIWGTGPLGYDWPAFATFVRQNGSDIYDADGEITLQPEDVEAWLDLERRSRESGAAPDPGEAFEQVGVSPEQSGMATNRYAMGLWPSSQFTALAAASGADLRPLRMPSLAGEPAEHQMKTDVSQYWGAASTTQHPAEAQLLIDFLVNDVDAGHALLVSRGAPPNSAVRAAIAPELAPAEAQVAEFFDAIADEVVTTPLPPAGLADFPTTLQRWMSEAAFGRTTAREAADGLVADTKAMVQ
jgi:multiple sugar transport system substrate-binding protein